MAKTCLYKGGCTYLVFSHGFCKSHQWCRNDDKALKKILKQKEKFADRFKNKKKPVVKKATGELALFKEIWNERNHTCQLCFKDVPYFNVWNFHHVKTKAAHPELRLIKSNVIIVCPTCHFKEHNHGKEKRRTKSN